MMSVQSQVQSPTNMSTTSSPTRLPSLTFVNSNSQPICQSNIPQNANSTTQLLMALNSNSPITAEQLNEIQKMTCIAPDGTEVTLHTLGLDGMICTFADVVDARAKIKTVLQSKRDVYSRSSFWMQEKKSSDSRYHFFSVCFSYSCFRNKSQVEWTPCQPWNRSAWRKKPAADDGVFPPTANVLSTGGHPESISSEKSFSAGSEVCHTHFWATGICFWSAVKWSLERVAIWRHSRCYPRYSSKPPTLSKTTNLSKTRRREHLPFCSNQNTGCQAVSSNEISSTTQSMLTITQSSEGPPPAKRKRPTKSKKSQQQQQEKQKVLSISSSPCWVLMCSLDVWVTSVSQRFFDFCVTEPSCQHFRQRAEPINQAWPLAIAVFWSTHPFPETFLPFSPSHSAKPSCRWLHLSFINHRLLWNLGRGLKTEIWNGIPP